MRTFEKMQDEASKYDLIAQRCYDAHGNLSEQVEFWATGSDPQALGRVDTLSEAYGFVAGWKAFSRYHADPFTSQARIVRPTTLAQDRPWKK